MKVSTRSQIFYAAQKFSATNDVRYYLNGVHVEPCHEGGIILVATNGHVMAALHDIEGTCDGPCIISPVAIRATLNGMLEFDGKHCWLPNGNAFACKFIEARYPDWRVIFPADLPTGRVHCLNSSYASLCKSVTDAYPLGKKYGAMSIAAADDTSVNVITFDKSVPAVVAIMPLKNDLLKSMPSFITAKTANKEEAPAAKRVRKSRVKVKP